MGTGATKSYNIGQISGGSTSVTESNLYDKNIQCWITSGGTPKKTEEMLGDGMRTLLGDDGWIYEQGMYPRLAWTDTVPWAREIAIAAATPVLLSSEEQNADKVKPGLKLFGCDSGVVWKVMPQEEGEPGACLFVDLEEDYRTMACTDNYITPRLNDICIGTTTIGAYIHDTTLVKTVTLRRYVEPTRDTLTIDSLGDLRTLQAGVNSDNAFYYKGYLLPQFADSITFRITADIEMPDANWVPIGDDYTLFSGNLLGGGHTISNLHSNSTYSGLFGSVRGTIRDLNFANVGISGGTYKGAVCAELKKGKIFNCHVLSGSISGGSKYTGGIVGLSSGGDTIADCSNRATISCGSDGYSGGIVGCEDRSFILKVINCHNYAMVFGQSGAGGIIGGGNVYATNCHNEGAVSGSYCVGGIIGGNGYATNCHNTGDVTGISAVRVAGIIATSGAANNCYNTGDVTGDERCALLGGIVSEASNRTTNCYNVGTITATTGNAANNNWVGGICATGGHYVSECYNAGIVYGNNRKYVGGICGSGTPSYCYNSNTVRGTSEFLGAISTGGDGTSHCYYDKQLCTVGGLAGTDVAGKAEGLYTQNMISSAMSSLLNPGGASYWTYQTNLYPQLTAFAGTSPSLSSVMPVKLTDNEDWKHVSQSFYMHGCDVGDWNILQGNCIALDTAGTHCQTAVTGMGIVQLGASVNDTIYRKIRLLIRVGKETPLVIKSLTELKNFRDVINNSIGYYRFSDQTYHKTLPAGSEGDADYMEIRDGGLDLYFKLIVDINMSGEPKLKPWYNNWTPITGFSGDFNGDNHTISYLSLGGGDLGLFTTNRGWIENIVFNSCSTNTTGGYSGILCCVNYGTIRNVAVKNSTLDGIVYKASVCGRNYGTIKKSYSYNNTITYCGYSAGGIVVINQAGGLVDSCYSQRLSFTINGGAGTHGKGGIAGENSGVISNCEIIDSKITGNTSSTVGGICGYNKGGTIKNCTNRNTLISTSTGRTGGIVGYNYVQGSFIQHCYVTGGTVSSSGDGVGGICGSQYYMHSNNRISNCINENPVKGANYVGGITGQSSIDCWIDYCENRAPVSGSYYVGGICGGTPNGSGPIQLYYNVNRGEVTGSGSYVGGILGFMSNNTSIPAYGKSLLKNSFNIAPVKGVSQVGGIVGANNQGKITACYNAGIVTGVTKVGGLIGEQLAATENSEKNYNTGYVKGTTMVGGVCGYSVVNKFNKCYYDKQMCPVGGVCGEDTSYAQGKLTSEMTGTGLQSVLANTDWQYSSGMYPRLKQLDTGAVALSSVLPVWLPNTPKVLTADDLPVGHYGLSGCDSTYWVLYEGKGLSFPSCDTLSVNGRNFVKIANVVNGDTLKIVKLHLGISEENPLEIISLEQFKKFRDLINSNNVFYYDDDSNIFYPEDGGDYVRIEANGEDMFFKLVTDIDLSFEQGSWIPIGSFKGHFNGGGHIVTGMKITASGNNKGLFGSSYGSLKNLTMISATIDASGNQHGALVGRNEGLIKNCRSVGGSVTGGQYVGGLIGYNSKGQVSFCYSSTNIKATGSYAGGISGYTTNGLISQCFNAGHISARGKAGGITGACNHELSNCYNVGSITGSDTLGGIVGWSTNKYISYCYNAGYVSSYSSNPTYVGAVTSCDSTNINVPNYCFYDCQMCTLTGGIGQKSSAINSSNKTTSKFTEQMIGTQLSGTNGLSSTYWIFSDSLYPRLNGMENLDGSIVSVQPVFISEHLKCDDISLPFTVKTNDSITWSRYGTGVALNVSALDQGKLRPIICGDDSLKVSLRNDFKIVPLYVTKLQAATIIDTACDGYYLWAASGRIYTESGKYTVALTVNEGCDSVMNLQLTIPPVLQIEMASQNYDCYESDNAYAQATVTGGFGQGYIYVWTSGDGDTVSTSNRIDNPEPGTYHFSVRDAVHPVCEMSADVTITKPTELVLTPGTADSRCYNQNDGLISYSVAGGTLPYVLTWSGTSSGSKSIYATCTDTITGLADGSYTLTLTDYKGCSKTWNDIIIADDDTPYSVTAYGVSKTYDGASVETGYYVLDIGSVSDTVESGGYRVLTTGDTLRASVSLNTTEKDVCNKNNNVTSCTITRDGEDKSCRYNLSTTNSIVEISRRNVTLTSASDNKPYDGTALTNRTVTVGGDGFAEGEDTLSCNVTGSQTLAGASPNTFTYTLKDNTSASNYDIQKTEGSLVVATLGNVVVIANSAARTYDGTPLTNPGYTCAGAPIASTDTLIATVSGTITNAGTVSNVITEYKVVRKSNPDSVVTGNYTFDPPVNGTLTVNRRNVTLSTVSDSKVYDSAPLSRPTITLSGDGFVPGEVTSYSASQSITDAGTVSNAIDIVTAGSYLADNYNLTKNEGTLSVTKRPLSIIGDSRSEFYDGTTHTITTYTAPNLLTGNVISGISYSVSGMLVGNYIGAFSDTENLMIRNSLSQDVTSNYDVSFVPGALTIGRNMLELEVRSNSNSFMYDGNTHKYESYTVLYNGFSVSPTGDKTYNLSTGDVLTIIPTGIGATGITHVSESGLNTFSISLENAGNYGSISLDTGILSITKRPVELRSQNLTSTYSGIAIPTILEDTSVNRALYGFVGSENVICTITGSQINVGSSPNTFTYEPKEGTDTNDYEIASLYGTLTITPATLTIVADDKDKVYREVNPTFTYSISGFVNGEDTTSAPFTSTVRPTMSTTATSTSPSGYYPIDIITEGVTFQNYMVTPWNGTLTIHRRPITVQALSVSGITYDGNRHSWLETAEPHYQITSGSLLPNDSIFSIILSGSRVVAGTTPIEPSNAIIKHYEDGVWGDDLTQNYEVTYVNGNITISPVEISIKPLPFTHDFDGRTFNSDYTPAPHYVITAGELKGNDTIVSMTINGSRSSYGKTPFVIDRASIIIVDKTEVTDYSNIQPSQLHTDGYDFTLLKDTLTVNHRSEPYHIDIYGKDSTMIYNAQNRSLTGWETDRFEIDGFSYKVVDVVSKVVNKDTVNTYPTIITGTPRVLGANDEDVSSEFTVTTYPGALTIAPKPVTVTAKGVTVECDFLEHTYKDNLFPYSTASGLCPGHNIDSIAMTGSGINVGRYPIHIIENSVRIKNTVNNVNVTNNYDFILIDSAIHITERTRKDTLRLVSRTDIFIYSGTDQTLTGFDTLRFMVRARDAQQTPVYFHIDSTSVAASTGGHTVLGTYKNAITGTPVVLDANETDVSSSFVVLADTGTLTITKRPITVTARDTTFYYDGAAHNASQMHDPKFTVDNLCAGHTVITTVTSADQTAIGSTPTILGTVTVRDASSNDVTSYFQITKQNGTLTVSGFPGAITITSASAELECDGTAQKREEYAVTFAGSPVTSLTGSGGLKFVLPTVNNDTLTVTPTFAGISVPSQNAPNNNVYTYVLQHDVQYVGTRTVTFGTIKMYDSLKVVTAETPVTCNGDGDGKSDVTISGGKKDAGNYSYKLDGGSATNTTGTVNLTNLGSGSHSFYVKDSLGYEKTVTITITQPDALTLTLTTDDPVYGDGTIMSHSTGGNGGNKYRLNGSDETDHGVYNNLSAGSYTVTVTDAKGCTSTESATLTATAVTEIEGVTRSGQTTSYAKDSTVSRSGSLTDFPALTRSGDVIAQPALDSLRATVAGQTVTVEARVKAVGAATVLELEVATDGSFTSSTVMYTYKFTGTYLTTGWKSHGFADLPAGSYHIRAKLYNGVGTVTRTLTDPVAVP